jgi:hypothetical protein
MSMQLESMKELKDIEELDAQIIKALEIPRSASLFIASYPDKGGNGPCTEVMAGASAEEMEHMLGALFCDLQNLYQEDFTMLIIRAQMAAHSIRKSELANMKVQGNG